MDSDSSESEESEDNQNNRNRQFNERQTKELRECINKVLAIIEKKEIIKKKTHHDTKRHKIPSKDEIRTHIQNLCNVFRNIAPTQPAVPSKSNEPVPGTSRCHAESAATSRHCTKKNVPETSRNKDTSNNRTETSRNKDTSNNRTETSRNKDTSNNCTETSRNKDTSNNRTETSRNKDTSNNRTETSRNKDTSNNRTETSRSKETLNNRTETSRNKDTSTNRTETKDSHGTVGSRAAVPETSERHSAVPKTIESRKKENKGTLVNRTKAAHAIPRVETESVHLRSNSQTIPPESSRRMETESKTSQNHTESTTKPVKDVILPSHGQRIISSTVGRSATADSRISETRLATPRRHSETNILENSRRDTDTEAVSPQANDSDVVKSNTPRPTIVSETLVISKKVMPGTYKTDSLAVNETSSSKTIAVSSKTSENNNIPLVSSINTCGNVPHRESNHSQICGETELVTSKNQEINNNSANSRNGGGNLKRSHINSYNDETNKPKNRKCEFCPKLFSNDNDDWYIHKQQQHGIHYEMKHNKQNFQYKMHGYNKRLVEPIDKKKKKSEENIKIATESPKITINSKDKISKHTNKRTAARSFSTTNANLDRTVTNSTPIIADSDEPADKKKRKTTTSDSAPNERIDPTEPNRNTALNECVIDLTEDNDSVKSTPPTVVIVKICSPKPADNDPDDDTSLYDDKEIKSAETLLMAKKEKEEQSVNNQLNSHIEVVSDFFPRHSNNRKTSSKGSHKCIEQITGQIKQKLAHGELQKRHDCEAIVPETTLRGAEAVSGSSINRTQIKYSNTSKIHSETSSKTTRNNSATTELITSSENYVPPKEVDSHKKDTKVSDKTLETRFQTMSSKGMKKQVHLTQKPQGLVQRDQLKNRIDSTRKTPYDKPNNTLINEISSGDAVNSCVNATKVSMINTTTTITTQSTEKNYSSVKKHTPNANNSYSIIPVPDSKAVNSTKDIVPKTVTASLPNSTSITPVQTQNTSQSSAGKHSSKTIDVPQSLKPTPSTQASSNIAPSNSMLASFFKDLKIPPPVEKCRALMSNLDSVIASQNPVSHAASVLTPSRESVTKPRQNLPTQNRPAHMQTDTDLTVYPIMPLEYRAPTVQPTPSTSTQSRNNHLHTREKVSRLLDMGVGRPALLPPSDPRYNAQSKRKKFPIIDTQTPSPYRPRSSQAATRDQNIFSSNIAPTNTYINRTANTPKQVQQTYRWHTPVEPENALPECANPLSQRQTQNVSSSSVSLPNSAGRPQLSARPITHLSNNVAATANQRSSISEVGRPNHVTPRQQVYCQMTKYHAYLHRVVLGIHLSKTPTDYK